MSLEKQLNPESSVYKHRNSLIDKVKLTNREAQNYEMKVFDCDKATKKMYEYYYKHNKYT